MQTSPPSVNSSPRWSLTCAPAWLAAVVLVGCQNAEQQRHDEIDRIAAQHAAYLEEFRLAQIEFARGNPSPRRIDFGPDGSILVRECELQGRPGSESLRVKFTYVNSTARTLDSAQVFITLRDPESGAEWSEVTDVRVPFGLHFGPNSTHTSYFEIPLHGIYRRPGWEWELSVQTADVAG